MGSSTSKPTPVPVPVSVPTPEPCPTCTPMPNIIYYRAVYKDGNQYKEVKGIKDAAGCASACKADPGCDAWNHMWGDSCYLLKNTDKMYLAQTPSSWNNDWSAGGRDATVPEAFVGRRSS